MSQINGNHVDDDGEALVSVEIKQVLKKLVEDKGISNMKIKINAGSMKGDNYLGIIAQAQVSGTDAKGNDVCLDLIVKSAPKSEGFRTMAPIRLAYEREIYMYSTVLPEFVNFQKEKLVKNPFKAFAKCLKTSFEDKDEALIMEDMKSYGFKMQNRRNPLNLAHVTLVLKELARFHSFSFAIRDQNPELLSLLEKSMEKTFFGEMDKEQFDKHGDIIYEKALASLDPIIDGDSIERYKKYKDTINDDLFAMLESREAGQYAVVRHGDCWTNNFLFAYDNEDEPNMPTELCFLDWQITCFGSPVLDLLYFLYSCTDKNLRDSHYDQLLKDYYKELKEFTAELGSDIDKLFPYDVFMEHMQRFGRYGLAIATMLIHLMTSESDEVPDVNTAFDSGDDIVKAFSFESKNQDYYYKRIRDVILHQIEKNYI